MTLTQLRPSCLGGVLLAGLEEAPRHRHRDSLFSWNFGIPSLEVIISLTLPWHCHLMPNCPNKAALGGVNNSSLTWQDMLHSASRVKWRSSNVKEEVARWQRRKSRNWGGVLGVVTTYLMMPDISADIKISAWRSQAHLPPYSTFPKEETSRQNLSINQSTHEYGKISLVSIKMPKFIGSSCFQYSNGRSKF
jgi:hypothetical protein